MDLGPHAGFIIAAYFAAAGVVLGLIVWVIVDYAMQRHMLADLDSRGVTRRSDKPGRT
jgi:heme exporter protein D